MNTLTSETSPSRSNYLTLDVVAPCFNEGELVRTFFDALSKSLDAFAESRSIRWRLIMVDDGSRDSTLDHLNALAKEHENVVVCSLTRNFGHQIALSAGLSVADADFTVLMDSDLQHPPQFIGQMLDTALAGGRTIDVVAGVRQTTADASIYKRFTSQLFYIVFNMFSDTAIRPGVADFVLLSRRARQAIVAMPERHRFLRGMIAWCRFPTAYLPYDAQPRAAGTSKYTSTKMVKLAASALFAFSASPLYRMGQLGLGIALAGLVYLGYCLWVWTQGVTVSGWASTMSVILVTGGIQIVCISVVGLYTGRLYDEAKNRPLFLFKQEPNRPPSQTRVPSEHAAWAAKEG